MNKETHIEAYLFWRNEPVKIKKIAEVFSISEDEAIASIDTLKDSLSSRGIVLMMKGEGREAEVMLGTSTEASELIEKLTKEELSKELSKAALETLSIVLYKGPVRRAEIDYIRGVNSQFILRHLEIRGLVEKVQSPDDARAFLYKPTFDLLGHLGISKIEELPEFDALRKAVEDFQNQNTEADKATNSEEPYEKNSGENKGETSENSPQ